MKVVLISMPDVVPAVMHQDVVHMPNHGIACVGGNIGARHRVFLIDLIRKRTSLKKYLTKTLTEISPDLVGLSAMTWQYNTCIRIVRLIKSILPRVRIALGGYHATLSAEEISASPEADLIDFLVRGEGEAAFRRLVDALDGQDDPASIPSLSFKEKNDFIHNERATPCDLSSLKLPLRDERRLTRGYHLMFSGIECLETSRGCTRGCNFCSMQHMYGKSYRTYPVLRIMDDLDDIRRRKKTRTIFVVDDNLVLSPAWVDEICEAILQKGYRDLRLMVQADCLSIARNAEMVRKMGRAGFRAIFLGIENASAESLAALEKYDVTTVSRQAVDICHRSGIMVLGGAIFGLPDDDEDAIRRNYVFLNTIGVDAVYCQILTPYPQTRLREQLLEEGLVTNRGDFSKYNGFWANVRTRHLSAEQLQYFFWYYRQNALGWWTPSAFIGSQGAVWTALWQYLVKPVMQFFFNRKVSRAGWQALHEEALENLQRMNAFSDLQTYSTGAAGGASPESAGKTKRDGRL
ncbi:MAG: B12-binding domain-containing radical SAM protein [Deltaproteobacteria bacterium]